MVKRDKAYWESLSKKEVKQEVLNIWDESYWKHVTLYRVMCFFLGHRWIDIRGVSKSVYDGLSRQEEALLSIALEQGVCDRCSKLMDYVPAEPKPAREEPQSPYRG